MMAAGQESQTSPEQLYKLLYIRTLRSARLDKQELTTKCCITNINAGMRTSSPVSDVAAIVEEKNTVFMNDTHQRP